MTTRAADIKIDSDEGGWYLTVEDVEGNRHDFNIHAVASDLVREAAKIAVWEIQGRAAATEHEYERKPYDQEEAYDLSDPKHPRHHEVYSDLAAMKEEYK